VESSPWGVRGQGSGFRIETVLYNILCTLEHIIVGGFREKSHVGLIVIDFIWYD
jgi:hypothetical protein